MDQIGTIYVTHITFVFPSDSSSFQGLAADYRGLRFRVPAERHCMGFHYFAGAAYRALTARKDGPSLYDVCDPLLLDYRGGAPHLGKFYRTALGNPALRPLLRRTGLPQLRDERRLTALRAALTRARDDETPDWT